jgi:hypothetical protein
MQFFPRGFGIGLLVHAKAENGFTPAMLDKMAKNLAVRANPSSISSWLPIRMCMALLVSGVRFAIAAPRKGPCCWPATIDQIAQQNDRCIGGAAFFVFGFDGASISASEQVELTVNVADGKDALTIWNTRRVGRGGGRRTTCATHLYSLVRLIFCETQGIKGDGGK